MQISYAEERSTEQPMNIPPSQVETEPVLKGLDEFQAWLGSYVGLVGSRLDGFLANEASYDRYNGSRATLWIPYTLHDNGEVAFTPNITAKLELPNLNRRWNLFVSSLNQEVEADVPSEDKTQPSKAQSALNAEPVSAQVGVRYITKRTVDLVNFLDVGFNAHGLLNLPSVYVRYKSSWQRPIALGWQQRLAGKVFWESSLGVGTQFEAVHDHGLVNKNLLFRLDTQANWWDHQQFWDVYHDFILFHKWSDRTSIAYFTGWNWNSYQQGMRLVRYSLGTSWRYRLYQKWMYLNIKPLSTYTEQTHFSHADLSLNLTLEMQFYQPK
jgi:hypothetical protein